MKPGWEVRLISEVCFIQEGPGIRKYEYEEGGYPMINVRCVQDGYIDMSKARAANKELATGKWEHFQVQAGDILFTISGTIGRCAVVKEYDLPLLMNTSVVRFKSISDELDTDYLYYFLQSDLFKGPLLAKASGTAIKNVGPTHIKKLSIVIPPLEEQRRIVALLDQAFEGLDRARANTEANLNNARELFGIFLKNATKEMSSEWEESTIAEIAIVKSGTTVPKSIEKAHGDVAYLKVADMNIAGNESLVTTSTRFLNEDDLKESWIVPAGASIFPKRGGAIKTNKKRLTTIPTCLDLNIMAVIPNEKISSEFLFLYFLGVDMREIGSGTTIPQINNYDIAPLIVRYPSAPEAQMLFVEKANAIRKNIQENIKSTEIKLAMITNLRQSLLAKAFAGELT